LEIEEEEINAALKRVLILLVFLLSNLTFLIQCGKPYFSNTRQNGEWTEISTRQNEIELAMFDE
jgi:hypothetical protein